MSFPPKRQIWNLKALESTVLVVLWDQFSDMNVDEALSSRKLQEKLSKNDEMRHVISGKLSLNI